MAIKYPLSFKLRGTNIYITEDMSKKMREHRHELQKYARQASSRNFNAPVLWREIQMRHGMLQVRSRSPQKKVTIRSDKLYIDNVMYCYDDDKHEVVRWNRPPSPPRPGSRLGYTWGPRNFDFRVGPI